MSTTMRVSPETRERLLKVAAEDFDGVSADEAVSRLLDEHWQAKCIAAVESYRVEDPDGWADYLQESEELSTADAAVTDPWEEPARTHVRKAA